MLSVQFGALPLAGGPRRRLSRTGSPYPTSGPHCDRCPGSPNRPVLTVSTDAPSTIHNLPHASVPADQGCASFPCHARTARGATHEATWSAPAAPASTSARPMPAGQADLCGSQPHAWPYSPPDSCNSFLSSLSFTSTSSLSTAASSPPSAAPRAAPAACTCLSACCACLGPGLGAHDSKAHPPPVLASSLTMASPIPVSFDKGPYGSTSGHASGPPSMPASADAINGHANGKAMSNGNSHTGSQTGSHAGTPVSIALADSVSREPSPLSATSSPYMPDEHGFTGPRPRSNSKLHGTMNRLKGLFLSTDQPRTENASRSSESPTASSVSLVSSQAAATLVDDRRVQKPEPHDVRSSSSTDLTRSTSTAKWSRFVVSDDGTTHTHQLKTAKRQERLSYMIRDFLGGKKHRDEAAAANVPAHGKKDDPKNNEQPPSLMAGFLHELNKSEQDAEALLSQLTTSSAANSFVKKYGKCHEVIGKGSFGIVRIAHKMDPDSQREQLYAVKEFKKRPTESEQAYSKRLTSEFCISSSLHHPNIIQTLDLLHDAKGEYCEVMEYCSGGDLYSLILVAGKLEYLEADCFFKQIVRGVNYMHEMGVAHRDLKPENILLTTSGAVKITDFGNGECFRMAWEKEVHLSNGVCGSAPYIAPEEFTDPEFDPRALDIWAIGVIYMAMRTGRHLWRIAKAGEDEFYSSYLQGRKNERGYEPIESLKRARCRNVIYSILDPVPSRRITGKQILKSEWGREIHVCDAGENGH